MFKRKSVLYTWCLSYGLLLLMMVVMCIMLGRNARNQLISEYKSITQTLQKQSNNAINDYFDELERCAYEISNDYLVNDFVSTPDPSGSKYYNLQPIQQSLSVYARQSGGEVSRYLYMDNIGRALSSDAIFRLHEFYASLGLEAAMSAGDFTTLLQDYHYNELYVFETGGKSEALMLTSVPLVGGTPKGTLVQVMNPETIAGMIQSNSAVEDSTTVLLDSDGSLLSATGDAAVAELLENADVSSAEDSEITLGGQLYWIQRERLPKAGWHLITVVPMSSIGAKSDWIIRRALPVMLAMVCMTAVLCLCFLYIQYKPLNRLRKELAGTAEMSMTSCWLRLQTQKAAEIRYKCCGRTRGTSCGRNLCSPALKATLYMMKSICIRSWSVWMPASAAIGSVWSCWTPEAERRRCWTAAVSVKRWRIF